VANVTQKNILLPMKKYENLFSIVVGALFLLFAAYINGFPIVYSDTSTYLSSGFTLETPFDRPITYGLFLRLCSLNGFSLWSVIFVQAFLLAYLIFSLMSKLLGEKRKLRVPFLGTMLVLANLSTVSWTVCQLITDVFTPILLLTFILLVLGVSAKRKRFWLYALFLLATAMHLSHVSFNLLLILGLLLLRQLNFLGLKKQLKLPPLLICLLLTPLSILSMGSAMAKSKHAFLMGALVEHGIVKEYLNDKCASIDYQFCAYKDSLPEKAWQFLWLKDSPFHKMGAWKATREEFNDIIYATLTEPKYLALHVDASLKATVDQLGKFKIGDGNGAFLEGSRLHQRMQRYVGRELESYEHSLQSRNNLSFLKNYNLLLYGVVIAALIGLLILLWKGAFKEEGLRTVACIVVLGILLNAWACATLANAIDRLGSKMIWLIPLLLLLAGFSKWTKGGKESSE
jgi:hypothetical protein